MLIICLWNVVIWTRRREMSYKTVKAEPNNSTYLDTYAWILFEKGNYAEARIYIDNAMKNDGEKSDVIVEHCGRYLFYDRRCGRCVEILEEGTGNG